ncbi:FAD/NAD(P)-binding protein [Rufibacter hautae]|uniref:Oxidoreductase n=1 Tax=Rufibacter hautae TaxID=2595005 RepID=A0A5B6T7K5_9BACT|nr:FAD/NAD(P)-binding protein [Rufibacter hautae]KAA3436178.1 oxidoreductase [Rufibacter hautae]
MEQTSIAIVGGGLSGTLTAIHLLRAARTPTTVYLIEKEARKLHRGVAYSSSLPFQPLNVPAARMTLFPEVPDHFVDWLREHQTSYASQLPTPVTQEAFIPRCIFGDYVEDCLASAEAKACEGVKLVRVNQEVISLEQKSGGPSFVVSLTTGSWLMVQKVVLALGNLPPADIPISNRAFYGCSLYKASPWSPEILDELPLQAPLLLLGSSLTMVDLVGSLIKKGHQGKIYVVSRHGLLPQAHQVDTVPYPLAPVRLQNPLSPLKAMRLLRKEIRKAAQEGYSWHSVVDALRDSLSGIWQNFTLQEKKQFLRHVKPYWEIHRHRMPLASSLMLQQLQEKGQLVVKAASLVDLYSNGRVAQVKIRERHSAETHMLEVGMVINCTGPLCDYTKSQDPLIQHLQEQGMIQADELKMGITATKEGNILNAAGLPVENLFTIGPPMKGMLYESTALREIRQQAASLASLLLFGETMLAAAL